MDFQRNATAGAPKGNGGYKRDEDFDPPPPAPTGNITSQQPPAAAQTQSRQQTFVPADAVTPACDEDVSHFAIIHICPFSIQFKLICRDIPLLTSVARAHSQRGHSLKRKLLRQTQATQNM
jgi:hypothetical protein